MPLIVPNQITATLYFKKNYSNTTKLPHQFAYPILLHTYGLHHFYWHIYELSLVSTSPMNLTLSRESISLFLPVQNNRTDYLKMTTQDQQARRCLTEGGGREIENKDDLKSTCHVILRTHKVEQMTIVSTSVHGHPSFIAGLFGWSLSCSSNCFLSASSWEPISRTSLSLERFLISSNGNVNPLQQ